MSSARDVASISSQPSSGGRRDERIDFWRGLCLVGMVSWHILDNPSIPTWLSFGIIQSFNFVAEGFILLAGAAVGIVAARAPGGRPPAARFLHRAVQLLLVHYIMAVVLLVGFHAPNAWTSTPDGPFWKVAWSILALEYQPPLGDILSVFVFLFAATPVFLAIQRRFGSRVLFAASLALYVASNLAPQLVSAKWLAAVELNHFGAFDFNTWQLVFVCGILFGQHREPIMARAGGRFWTWLAISLLAFAAVSGYRLQVETHEGWSDRLPEVLLFSRHPLSPARLVYTAMQMLLIGLITVRFWNRFADTWPARTVVLFGQHSLTVFVASVFLDYLLKAAIGGLGDQLPIGLAAWAIEVTALYFVAAYGRRATRRVKPTK